MKKFVDDFFFEQSNPNHPLASNHRFKRIKAEDNIINFTKELHGKLPNHINEELKQILTDCCAAVKNSIS